jgi:hypothetical protein
MTRRTGLEGAVTLPLVAPAAALNPQVDHRRDDGVDRQVEHQVTRALGRTCRRERF